MSLLNLNEGDHKLKVNFKTYANLFKDLTFATDFEECEFRYLKANTLFYLIGAIFKV